MSTTCSANGQPPRPTAQLARVASTTLVITPARPLTLCRGSFTQIQASIPADFTPNWYWTKDGAKFSQDREVSVTVNEPGTYTLGGDWESDPNVTVNGVFTLTIIDLPVTAVKASATSVCAGQSFTLTASPSSATNQYNWVDSQHRFIVAGPELATNSPDAYSLVVVSPSACTYVAAAPLVTAYASQTITLKADGPTAFCEGNSVRLTQGGGDLINPVWTRNGQILTDPFSPTLTVSDEGTYAVRGDGAGCIQFPPPISVTVGARPSAQLMASQPVVCQGSTYELAVQPADPANTYVWLNQAGKVVNSLNVPRITVADEAIYSLRISTPAGCTLLITSERLVQFVPSTTLHINPAGSLSICQGNSTTLTASGGDVSAYYWTRNGTRIPGSDGLGSFSASQSGVYALDGPFPTCVTAPDKPTIAVTPIPTTTLIPSQTLVCEGDAFQLLPTPNRPDYQYRWTDETGKAVFDGPVLSTTRPGIYRLAVTTSTPCTFTTTSTGLAQFRPTTLLRISPDAVVQLCQGQTASLTAAVGTLTGYTWTRDGGNVPNSLNVPTLVVREAGVYSLTGTFPACTRSPDLVQVRMTPPPTVSLVAGSLTLCAGQQTTITAQTDGANTLHWLRDGVDAGTAQSQTANASTAFSLTVTAPTGCQQTATYAFNPPVFSIPDFNLGQSEPVWQNALVQPGNVPENPGYRYQWLPPAGVSDPTVARPLLNPAVATSYTLTITDEHGCQFSDQLTLTLFTQLLTPTAFSPNGDGQNDTWAPVNLDRYPNAELYVYDRWGALVYAGRSGEAPFDGTLRGEPLPNGIYTYRIRLNIQQIESRGTLRLLR
ncbi:gliding motility-associated C-terminal domain-containing protein [Fibrella sp. WM1]|uniref:gliding motility-associated C-terminal domain-containing protein n=1 Tax=Fibrella musci TaxID=3242485 RepID=UPI0035200537